MRILFTFAGGPGHAYPMLPIAHAARAAGHSVAVAGRPSALEQIDAAGFATFPTGPASAAPRERVPLQPVDIEREQRAFRDHYADRLARMRAAHAVTLCGEWHPDVIVRDEANPGVSIAAEHLGIPHATVVVLAAGGFARADLVAEPLNALRAEYGLSPDPEMRMLERDLVLSPFPPSFRDPRHPLPAGCVHLRPVGIDAGAGDTAPPWMRHLDGAPRIYFTLGTEFNVESGDLFARALAGLRNIEANLVVTVGPDIDPAELGPQPPNVHIVTYLPQALVLPHCDAVVSHGGSGTVIGALAHGLPVVNIAMGADQPHNAEQCERLGVGRTLDPVRATPEDVRAAVSAVLSEPGYRQAAERVRAEIATLPGPEHALTLLERLAP